MIEDITVIALIHLAWFFGLVNLSVTNGEVFILIRGLARKRSDMIFECSKCIAATDDLCKSVLRH